MAKAQTKKATTQKKETETIVFDFNKTYVVIAGKGNKHLKEGQEYEVSGEIAGILVNRGSAKLK